MTPIRVLLVDDHGIVREGVRQVLQADADFAVVGEAGNGDDALRVARETHPDVVLLDLTMPGQSGLVVAQRLREALPEVKVLVLSVHDDTEYVLRSVRAGAHGYLRKDTTPADLRTAVRAVHAGDGYFSPAVARRLAEAVRGDPAPPLAPDAVPAASPPATSPDVLTPREREVLVHIAQGLLNKEVAVRLGISVRTVEAHRDSLIRKLGIRSAAGLARFALAHGLIPASPDGDALEAPPGDR